MGVQPGDQYVFEITTNNNPHASQLLRSMENVTVASTIRRIDPKSADVSDDGTFSIVPMPYTFRNERVKIGIAYQYMHV